MDVTLTKKQEEALAKFIEGVVGETPSFLDHSRAANERRAKIAFVSDWLHRFAALNMRIGHERALFTLGMGRNKDALPVWVNPKDGSEAIKVPTPDSIDGVKIQ